MKKGFISFCLALLSLAAFSQSAQKLAVTQMINDSIRVQGTKAITAVTINAVLKAMHNNAVDSTKAASIITTLALGPLTTHTSNVSNPHSVTKTQVGLSNVDNTSDVNKPVSTAQATAIALKQDAATAVTLTGTQTLTNKALTSPGISTILNGGTITVPTTTGTLALVSQITGTNSGTNTGDETATTIKAKLGISTLSGSNTGDQDLSGYSTTTQINTALALKANLADPVFSGVPKIGTDTVATRAYARSVGGGGGGGLGDASTNTSTSVDGELALFSGTGGKTIKRATGTGFAKVSSGVFSVQSSLDTTDIANFYLKVRAAFGVSGGKINSSFLPDNTFPDFTESPTGTFSITNGAITNTKLANMANATFKGRATAGTGAPEDLTASQVKTLLSLDNVSNTSDATKNSATATLTNKRWTARVGSATSSAAPTINTDNVDIYKLTAQTADITSFTTNLTGTPVDGDVLEIQITGTAARAITWGASFVSSTVTLPTTTVTTTTLTTIFQYYTTSSYGNNKWVCVNSF